MHVPAGHRFPDATGVAFASAWARHRCLQLYLFFFFFFSKLNRILEGLNMLKVRKLCTRVRTGENLRLIWDSEVGVAKWLDSATYKYSAECASSYVSRTCTKSVHLCNLTIPTKKSPGTKSETQQEVGYFEFSRHILCHFCHFQVSYFNELLPEIYSDEHQNWSL